MPRTPPAFLLGARFGGMFQDVACSRLSASIKQQADPPKLAELQPPWWHNVQSRMEEIGRK